MIVGERLRNVREKKNLSQCDIEKRTGLLRCYISRVENGHTVPAIETLEKMARALEVPLYQLFYYGEEPPKIDNVMVMKPSSREPLGQRREGCPLFQQAAASVEQGRRRRQKASSAHGTENGESLKHCFLAEIVGHHQWEHKHPKPSWNAQTNWRNRLLMSGTGTLPAISSAYLSFPAWAR